MAKIALLLSGFVRDHRLDSVKEYVVDPNLAVGNEVDVYVSTWDTRGTVSTTDAQDAVFTGREYWSGDVRTYDNSPIDREAFENDVRRVTPHRAEVRFNNYETQARKWLAAVPEGLESVRGKDEHTILRIKGMWFGLSDAFSMIPDPGDYDFVIRCRLDIRFRETFTPGVRGPFYRRKKVVSVGDVVYDLDPHVQLTSDHIARVRGRLAQVPAPKSAMLVPLRDNGYVDDWFAIGVPESMRAHMNAFSRLDDYLLEMRDWPEPYESESITVLNAMRGGVNLVGFPKTIYQ